MEPEITPHPASTQVIDFADWAANATESMYISLARPQEGDSESAEPVEITTFNPDFTYPIFGDHETIFGYKDLSIELKYSSGSLQPFLNIQYSSKYSGSYSIDDVWKTLQEYFPQGYITKQDDFIEAVKRDHTTFRPIGEKIHEYTRDGEKGEEHFEIYKCSFANQKFREYHARMQLFVLLFIEGGSYIEDDDEKWEIYTIFKKEGAHSLASYHFVGYCTAYPFYFWPENTRMRISQFLVLPPYKKKGHGSELYRILYQLFKSRQEVSEITVEDPSEEFADMRDKNDIHYLLEHEGFKGLKAPISRETFDRLHQEYKLTDRQLHRCIEIYLLSNVDKSNEQDYKAYRLQVKDRLYRFNYDILQELEKDERKAKLDETYLNLEDEYHRVLELI
ncbi:hypothetical protein G6F70_005007 [Rhizopus microsporus]|uniref:Histone acetyltransferase type B catalytic subunit n=1 Tax=Rhizopus microsporus TaxID=58291 RepID=A0A0A1N4J9_RHIZD|nr:hypothetical protein G6F71_008798 [Rhizopus microsporus]KAG1199359.1 hypothetical protein G6F70_005007 [Rhizopus microsporus]KAG1206448.1 hypothetical protein G6F69_008824 [Rhizopus microsporus]KAG1233051.1 hypothetical protein G6F67_004564 [Rhizopus microsporus]KAG1258565.1 hypothetical protein G6F68_008704 [Rhizopus microsporus]